MDTYTFHANLFALPPGASEGRQVMLRGQRLSTLATAEGLPLTFIDPLSATWESAAAVLEALPRMIFEMDGSFVWSGDAGGQRWQVDGHLFEFSFGGSFGGQPCLHRMELHGMCPVAEFEKLLRSAGWPISCVVFELVMEGVTLAEEEFRRWAAGC